MEKSCHSSGDSSNSNSNSNSNSSRTEQYLKQLNKSSLKISKSTPTPIPTPTPTLTPTFKKPNPDSQNHPPQHLLDSTHSNSNPNPNPNPSSSSSLSQPAQIQQQPPVYNIDKNDFRDVVQKLTGSPAHDRIPNPAPPVQTPKPQSSRLQRIRPPPLSHLPPPVPPVSDPPFIFNQRPRSPAPFSPLPPLPTVSTAAESPISAYLRYRQNPGSNPSAAPSPRSVPFPFFSPGFSALPTSPSLPVPSPRWKDA